MPTRTPEGTSHPRPPPHNRTPGRAAPDRRRPPCPAGGGRGGPGRPGRCPGPHRRPRRRGHAAGPGLDDHRGPVAVRRRQRQHEPGGVHRRLELRRRQRVRDGRVVQRHGRACLGADRAARTRRSWTVTEAPQPSNSGSGVGAGILVRLARLRLHLALSSRLLPDGVLCVAVGSYKDTAGYHEPVVDTLSGGTWTSLEPPLPSDAATDTTTNQPDAELYSVSCASATSCVAVGSYKNTSAATVAMIDTLSGSTWSTLPVTALPTGADGTFASLTGISCATAASCVAAGDYEDTDNSENGLLDRAVRRRLERLPRPEPANAGNDTDGHQFATVIQVVCPSSTMCVGVGTYVTASDTGQPLIDTWNGTTWTGQAGALPSNVAIGATGDILVSVSCGSPTTCTAVGGYLADNGNGLGLVDTLSGGTWTGTEAPQPADVPAFASQEADLFEVSCRDRGLLHGGRPVPVEHRRGTSGRHAVGGRLERTGGTAPERRRRRERGTYARAVACYSPVACVVGGLYHRHRQQRPGVPRHLHRRPGVLARCHRRRHLHLRQRRPSTARRGGQPLNKPMVGMAATPDGQGYWLVASDGGIFSLRRRRLLRLDAAASRSTSPSSAWRPPPTARATGWWPPTAASSPTATPPSTARRGGQPLNQPIVGMAATPDGRGYWLVASDGGIFSYGDALFYGSTGGLRLNKPVVGMAATPDGLGLLARRLRRRHLQLRRRRLLRVDRAASHLNQPVVGMAATPERHGLLAGRVRRWHLQLRRRPLLRARPGALHAGRTGGRHGGAERRAAASVPAGPTRRPDLGPAGGETPRRYPAPDGRPSGRSRGSRAQSA